MFRSIALPLLGSIFFLSSPFAAEDYVIGNLVGQLGNQMFIIATTVSHALDHDSIPVFPDLISQQQFNIPLNRKQVFFRLNTSLPLGIFPSYLYEEPHFHYAALPFYPNMMISGYFQSYKYFDHHRAEILELFAPSQEITSYLEAKYPDILSHPNTVAVHTRNYYEEDPHETCHYTYERDYFEKAMMLFPEDALFVIFSNKMQWCQTMLAGIPRTMIFIDGNQHYHDFYLMSRCKHNIICNSSFSWWAAYLNSNPDKQVITPPAWFNPNYGLNTSDLIPQEWISIN